MASERAAGLESSPQPASPEVGRTLVLPRLLTLAEVAKYLRVSPKTVRRWVAARRIPCVRFGTRLRFDAGDIASWVRQRKEG